MAQSRLATGCIQEKHHLKRITPLFNYILVNFKARFLFPGTALSAKFSGFPGG
jgi:hypothetical protein